MAIKALIIVLIVLVVVLVAVVVVLMRRLRGWEAEKRRVQAREHLRKADIRSARADQQSAAASEQAARAQRERAEMDERLVDRRQADLAGCDAVAADSFQVLEARPDHGGVQVYQLQVAGQLDGLLVHVTQQQLERVAVGGDGVRARSLLVHQPVGEGSTWPPTGG